MSSTILLQCISDPPLYTNDSQVNKTLPLVEDKIGNIPGIRRRDLIIKGKKYKRKKESASGICNAIVSASVVVSVPLPPPSIKVTALSILLTSLSPTCFLF